MSDRSWRSSFFKKLTLYTIDFEKIRTFIVTGNNMINKKFIGLKEVRRLTNDSKVTRHLSKYLEKIIHLAIDLKKVVFRTL